MYKAALGDYDEMSEADCFMKNRSSGGRRSEWYGILFEEDLVGCPSGVGTCVYCAHIWVVDSPLPLSYNDLKMEFHDYIYLFIYLI